MKGRIVQWHNEKGYGFIQTNNGNRKFFCHTAYRANNNCADTFLGNLNPRYSDQS